MLLLSVDSLGGVVGTTAAAEEEGEEEIPTLGNRKNNREDIAIFDEPAATCLAHALSMADRRHRFNSLFVVPSRLPLV